MRDYLCLGLCVTCHCGLVHLLYTLYSTTKMFYIRAFLSSVAGNWDIGCQQCGSCWCLITWFASGFGHNEVIKTVMLKETRRQTTLHQKQNSLSDYNLLVWLHLTIKVNLNGAQVFKQEREEKREKKKLSKGLAAVNWVCHSTYMWDYQIFFNVHQLLYSSRSVEKNPIYHFVTSINSKVPFFNASMGTEIKHWGWQQCFSLSL